MKITGYISQPEKNLYMQSVTPFESKKDDFGESAILGVITQLERQTLLGFGGTFTEAAFGREISYFFNAIKNDTDISDIARDGIVATDIIDGIYRSAATRCEVKL